MKINVNNEAKITAAINDAESNAQVRTIAHGDILNAIRGIQDMLCQILHKKDWRGLKFSVDPCAQSFPAAYRGIPESTHFCIEMGANDWFLTWVGRERTESPLNRIVPLNIDLKEEEIMSYLETGKPWSS